MHSTEVPSRRQLLQEHLIVLSVAGLYLFVCRTSIYSGDGYVYANQVEQGLLVWNPNHLLMNPIGFAWSTILTAINLPMKAIVAFKILSGVSTLVTLSLFHWTLAVVGTGPAAARVILTFCLLFSRNMLSMAISEEYFMIQMPLIVLVLRLTLAHVTRPVSAARERALLVAVGAFLGLAASVSINNLALAGSVGVWVALAGPDRRVDRRLGDAVTVWLSSVAVVAPILAFGYRHSGTSEGFFRWLTSYGGSTSSSVSKLYGLEWSARGIALGLMRLAFAFVNNVCDGDGAGAIAKELLTAAPVEYIRNYRLAAAGGTALLLTAAGLGVLAAWVIRHARQSTWLQLAICWSAGYLAFNLLWDNSDDQFWFQILPVLWLCVALFLGFSSDPAHRSQWMIPLRTKVVLIQGLAGGVILLFAANTVFVVAPLSFVNLDAVRDAHHRLVSPGMLEIYPGWDYVAYMMREDDRGVYTRISLFDVALGISPDGMTMQHVPKEVEKRLGNGNRVIVARLYDLDRLPGPWGALRTLGWSRAKIQALLSRYTATEIARIDGIVFRELSLPKASGTSAEQTP